MTKETEQQASRAKTGLVLQGGGALGAFEYGVLQRLYQEPDFSPDVISGISIGAINAACLVGAKGDPIKTLGQIWERFCVTSSPFIPDAWQKFMALFGNPSFFSMRLDYLSAPFWTSFYSTDPLRSLLREFIDFPKLNESRVNLLVSATNIRTGGIEVFDNRETEITEDHIVASGSLPPGFPMTTINGESYWDGGLFNNTPLLPVIERLDPDPDVQKHVFVINLFPNQGKVPRQMLDVFDRMFELIFSNKLIMDVKTARKVDEFLEALNEIERSLPDDAKQEIQSLPGYQRLRQYRIIKNLTVIENTEPELVFGPFDFSRKSLVKRTNAGYDAAVKKLGPAHLGQTGPNDRMVLRKAGGEWV